MVRGVFTNDLAPVVTSSVFPFPLIRSQAGKCIVWYALYWDGGPCFHGSHPNGSLCSKRNDFNYLNDLNIKEWWKMWTILFMFSKKNSAWQGFLEIDPLIVIHQRTLLNIMKHWTNHSRKYTWNYGLQCDVHFVQASMCQAFNVTLTIAFFTVCF